MGAAALLATPRGLGRDDERPSSRERARALYDQGLDHWARGEEQEMLRAMRGAWETDPSYLPPVMDAVRFFDSQALPSELRRELEALAARPDVPIRRCVDALLADVDGRHPVPVADADNTECGWLTQMMRFSHYATTEAAVREAAGRLAAQYPESPALIHIGLIELWAGAQWDSLHAWATRLTRDTTHPLLRALGFTYVPQTLHARSRHEDAFRAERALEQFARASPPRVRHWALLGLGGHRGGAAAAQGTLLAAHADSVWTTYQAWQTAIAREADPAFAITLRMWVGSTLLDNGDLAGSLAVWDTLVAAAESLDHAGLRAASLMRRGRTRVKLGDWPGAERDLLAARRLAAHHASLRTAYETEHNLLHLYEAQGRAAEARQAGERFVALTASGGLTPVRMMSRHDLGWFLQRRGEQEAARRHFEAMVADVDSLPETNESPYFAGEYYEAIGDLDRATAYYRRALAACSTCPRALEALALLAAETDDASAAAAYARESDRHTVDMAYPEWRPLLPGVLARAGRIDEAVMEFTRAREDAYRQGRSASWARLSLELAQLEAARGALALATAIADSAAAAAERVGDHETGVRARALAALGRIHDGDARTGLPALERSLRQARQGRLPQVEADVRVLHGDGLAALGRTAAALAEFNRAADLTDSIAVSLAHDPTRAGFRGATHLRVTNRALATIVARPTTPTAAREYAEWSARRKSRGTVGDAAARRAMRDRVRLADLQARLGPDRAVIDYVVLDTTVAALVVTDRAARIVRLPVAADILRSQVAALGVGIAPRVGSFVDRSRAAFDLAIARRVGTELLAPLDSLLGNRIQLTIVPDAPLHLVPFDALVVSGSDSAPAFALDRYLITLAPSLSDMEISGRRVPPGDVVAFAGRTAAGDAVGADREVDALADALRGLGGWHVTRFEGPAATEAAVRQHAAHATVLHLAAHARPNASQPDYGLVALAPEGSDDGRLYVHEIRHLRLPGSLVVLSACESAAGRLAGGQGPLSLSRAFLQAGASAVLGTLWPVDETAAGLMEEFYRGLARGDPPAVALRTAKLARRGGPDPSPLRWAAFELVGGGDAAAR